MRHCIAPFACLAFCCLAVAAFGQASTTAPATRTESPKDIAWSKPAPDGLQIGLRIQQPAVASLRDIQAEITIKNAGKTPLIINTYDLSGYFGLEVRNPDGKLVPKVPPPIRPSSLHPRSSRAAQ